MKTKLLFILLITFASICFGEGEKGFDQSKEYCHEGLQKEEFFILFKNDHEGLATQTWKSLFPQKEILYLCQKRGNSQECFKGAWGNYRSIVSGENKEDDEVCRSLKEKNDRFAKAIHPLVIPHENENRQDIYLDVNNPDVGKIARYRYGYNPDYSEKKITITDDCQVSYTEFIDSEQAKNLKKVLDILYSQNNKKHMVFKGETPSDYENMHFAIGQEMQDGIEVKNDGRYILINSNEVQTCNYASKGWITSGINNINPDNFMCKKLQELHNNPFRNTIDSNDKEHPIRVELGGIVKNSELVFDNIIFASGETWKWHDEDLHGENELKIHANGTIECLRGNCDELLQAARTYISNNKKLALYFALFIEPIKKPQ